MLVHAYQNTMLQRLLALSRVLMMDKCNTKTPQRTLDVVEKMLNEWSRAKAFRSGSEFAA